MRAAERESYASANTIHQQSEPAGFPRRMEYLDRTGPERAASVPYKHGYFGMGENVPRHVPQGNPPVADADGAKAAHN